MEKLRKLLSHFVNGHRSEKRILPAADQTWLPFDSSEEFQAAQAEAQAQAEAIIQTYTVTRTVTKKKRDESLPSHLPRVEKVIEGNDAQKNCPAHGERKVIGYDKTETLVYKRPELYVLVKKYAKYACPGNPACGVASPERPTSLVEGDRYDTSVAATVVEAKWFHHLPIYRHQDIFAGSGWTPSRSTLLNLVSQVQFVITPFIAYMTRWCNKTWAWASTRQVAGCCCRRRRRWRLRATPRANGWQRRSPRRVPRATPACWPRCGSTRACIWRATTSSTSACRGIGTAPTISSATAAVACREIASRET